MGISQAVFGMNIKEINGDSDNLPNVTTYIELAIPLTAVTIWIILSLQSKAHLDEPEPSIWSQMWWPFTSVKRLIRPRRGNYARVSA